MKMNQHNVLDVIRHSIVLRSGFATHVMAIVVLMLCAFPDDVWANLQFCNRTGSKVSVAIAYGQKDAPGTSTSGHLGVRVEGWWGIEPNQCATVSNIDAGNHWVYYYAHSRDGAWDGTSMLCVPSRSFETGAQFKRSGDRCSAGYRLAGFRLIQTAKKNHSHNLTRR